MPTNQIMQVLLKFTIKTYRRYRYTFVCLKLNILLKISIISLVKIEISLSFPQKQQNCRIYFAFGYRKIQEVHSDQYDWQSVHVLLFFLMNKTYFRTTYKI